MPSGDRPLVLWGGQLGRPLALQGGWELVQVDSEADLFERALRLQPDLVVVGSDLVGRGAIGCLIWLGGNESTLDLPVILLSQCPEEEEAVRALELGASDYLDAKVAPLELSARCHKAIRDHRQRRKLAELARTDALTGLANFGGLMARMDEEFQRSSRYKYALSVVMIDLDYLKQINDRFGHEVGNRALVTVARTLRAELRQTDFAGRYGGDEFVVLLPHQSPEETHVVVERVRRELGEARLLDSAGRVLPWRLTASVGVAGQMPGDWKHSFQALLQLADAALYEAKRTGRDKAVVSGLPTAGAGEQHGRA